MGFLKNLFRNAFHEPAEPDASSSFAMLTDEQLESHLKIARYGDFLLTDARCGPPAIEINLGGQTLERWPSALFVPAELAHQALDCFLTTGKQDPALRWIRINAFPRETVWEGREGREAWERANSATKHDV